eukprot:TRINITY_DN35447_c0_g1_i1.p1 TRINITY_DN35447_c0_g1~~TRINITY_DN35447_c0_g1_i1.p1  ORF type:complete len:218 (-),score=27.79 TRINITY_DN35447_c0_g1_i1:123-776(-)
MGQQCTAGVQRGLSRSFSLIRGQSGLVYEQRVGNTAASKKMPVVVRPVHLSVSSLAGHVCDMTADEAWSGKQVKELVEVVTGEEYHARGIHVFVGAEELLDETILCEFLEGATEAELLVTRYLPPPDFRKYDGEYEVKVAGAEFRFRFEGELVRTCFGDFGIEWLNDRECFFKLLNQSNEPSKWIIRFRSWSKMAGFFGTYQSNRTTRKVEGDFIVQ